MPKKQSNKPLSRGGRLKKETLHNVITLMTAAFGFVAALAWNTLTQAAFTKFLGPQSTLLALFGYAVVITVIAVVAITYISRLEVNGETER